MSWKCEDCGAENHDDFQKCQCGHISVSETSASPNRPDRWRFGDCSKAILVLLLASIANTFVTFKYNDFPFDGYAVPYYLGQGIGSILFLFVIFLIPAAIFNYLSKKNQVPYSNISLKVSYFTAAFSVILMIGQINIHNKESTQPASKEVARQPTAEKIKSPLIAAITKQGREGFLKQISIRWP